MNTIELVMAKLNVYKGWRRIEILQKEPKIMQN